MPGPPIPDAVSRARCAAALVVLATALAGCGDARTPASPDVPAARPALRDALADADARIVPALAPARRAPMHVALAELRAALDEGRPARVRRAASAVQALAAGGDDDERGAADLTAIDLLATLATLAAREPGTGGAR